MDYLFVFNVECCCENCTRQMPSNRSIFLLLLSQTDTRTMAPVRPIALLLVTIVVLTAHAQPQSQPITYDAYGNANPPLPSSATTLDDSLLATNSLNAAYSNAFNPYNGGSGGGGNALNSLTADLLDERNFCPEFWIPHHKVCYRFHKSPKRNWHEARRLCRAMNADLLSADTLDKHAFVLRELIVQDERQNRYYVSARQQSPGVWLNEDQSSLVQLDDGGVAYDEASDLDEDTLLENLNERRAAGRGTYAMIYIILGTQRILNQNGN